MVSYLGPILAIATLTLVASTSRGPSDPACTNPLEMQDGEFPTHRYSPRESVENYDVVLHAEVMVPTRECSLGFCAGIKVLSPIKGYRGKEKTVVRVAHGGNIKASCSPPVLQNKGRRWILFGKRKTTPGGLNYVEVATDHPNFPAYAVPDFEYLESQYFLLRARLDYAIEKKKSPQKQIR